MHACVHKLFIEGDVSSSAARERLIQNGVLNFDPIVCKNTETSGVGYCNIFPDTFRASKTTGAEVLRNTSPTG